MPSCLTSINTFSLSRTDFEIFDSRVFRVWSWPLTFRDHPRSKICPPFECPYMTSYSTPIDTFSLSRTVFEIFDFKGFRVWSWLLTFRGDPGSKIFSSFESPYMLSYLTSIGTFSLSRTVFEIIIIIIIIITIIIIIIIWFGDTVTVTHPTKCNTNSKVRAMSTMPFLAGGFPPDTASSTRPEAQAWPQRYSTSKFLGFDLDLWPLGVTRGQTYFHHLKAHIWLPI